MMDNVVETVKRCLSCQGKGYYVDHTEEDRIKIPHDDVIVKKGV